MVVVHYKMALSDEASFAKDEWGPWQEKYVQHNDPDTGRVELVKVLRTDPEGIELMKSYPDVAVNPGLTPWKEDAEWKRDQVFRDLANWQYSELNDSDSASAKAKWGELSSWHRSHQRSDTVMVGEPATMNNGSQLFSSLLPWPDMWKVLKSHVTASRAAVAPTSTALVQVNRRDRQAIAASTDAAEVNVVIHPRYSEANQRVARLQGSAGDTYVTRNISAPQALFFISLAHFEGELSVGLGRRTFDADVDQEGQQYGIEWFERKNRKVASWGKRPAFRLAVASYSGNRPVHQTSVEQYTSFLPVAVDNAGSTEKPALTTDCLSALRAYLQANPTETHKSEDELPIGGRKQKAARKMCASSDDD